MRCYFQLLLSHTQYITQYYDRKINVISSVFVTVHYCDWMYYVSFISVQYSAFLHNKRHVFFLNVCWLK